jgi:hypothetical protein
MKLLNFPLLVFALSICAEAQVPTSSVSGGHGLVVIAQKWGRDLRDPALDRNSIEETDQRQGDLRRRQEIDRTNDTLRSQGMPTRDVPTPEITPDTSTSQRSLAYTYVLKLRNDSGKEVSSVTWEYVFYAPGTEQEVGRRRFQVKERIRPGKTSNLVMHSAIPPTGTIDAAKAGKATPEKYSEKIVIASVEYADGSKWPF